MKYFDAFSESGYHSAFLTSFTFDGDAFESIVLNRLRNAGCNNIHAVSDFSIFKENLQHYGPPLQAGLRYHLALNKQPGAFHPKIVLQLGRDKARLLVGSANLTFTGLAGNLELVDEITCEGYDDPNLPLLAAAANYMASCFPEDDKWFRQGYRQALDQTPWFNIDAALDQVDDNETGLRGVLHTSKPETTIAQIVNLIGGDTISRLNVVSPFWDEKLAALWELSSRLDHPKIRIGIETDRGQFPTQSLGQFENISMHALNDFAKNRSLHAKLYIFEGQAFDHIVSGSMNCSAAALFSTLNKPKNVEFGIYRRLPSGQALEILKVAQHFELEANVSDIVPLQKSDEVAEVKKLGTAAQIILAQKKLTLTLGASETKQPDRARIYRSSSKADFLELTLKPSNVPNQWTARVPDKYISVNVAIIHFQDGTQSEPIVICNTLNLRESARSPNSLKIDRLLNRLNQFENENLDIIEILLDLEAVQKDRLKPKNIRKSSKGSKKETPEYLEANTVVSYEEFVRRSDEQSSSFDQRFLGSAHRYSSDVTNALNQLLGIVAPQLDHAADLDVNLNSQEPSENNGGEGNSGSEEDSSQLGQTTILENNPDAPSVSHQIAAYRHNTADKLVEAVSRFCAQFLGESAKPIDITKLTHARALIQVILSHSKPLKTKKMTDSKAVLPIIDKLHKREAWPRLIGKIMNAVAAALLKENQSDFSRPEVHEENRVIDSLAVIIGAGELAVSALGSKSQAASLLGYVQTEVEKLEMFRRLCEQNNDAAKSRHQQTKNNFTEKFL